MLKEYTILKAFVSNTPVKTNSIANYTIVYLINDSILPVSFIKGKDKVV